MGRARDHRSGGAGTLGAIALASLLLAACCPAPAGPPGLGAAPPAFAPASAEARLTVRTSAGPAPGDGRLARSEDGTVVRLVPVGAVALPADALLYVAGRWAADGSLHVSSATPLRADAR